MPRSFGMLRILAFRLSFAVGISGARISYGCNALVGQQSPAVVADQVGSAIGG